MYGFIRTENLHNIDFLDVKEKVNYNHDNSMFYITWEGDTPPSLYDILENVCSEENLFNFFKELNWYDLSECDGCPCTNYYKCMGYE